MEGNIRIYRLPKGRGTVRTSENDIALASLYRAIVKVTWRVFNQLNVCFLFLYTIKSNINDIRKDTTISKF